ncbi:6-phosphogluconate dehydrogenase C-terminal domain-like protein [Wilcoxina mikolae CBS 423.85]|nr:6-phosphogluconate dehydrogenase C-terminal domain-like protein [Wilcoxina mikolae CBS 423.85]
MPLTVAIISLGEMGVGIAQLLQAHSIPVITNLSGRSPATHTRATAAGITSVDTDTDLVSNADIILSIVPPAEALPTAQRIASSIPPSPSSSRTTPQYYVDLNATSPLTIKTISTLFPPTVRFLDAAIFGYPPSRLPDGSGWKRPRIAVSGQYSLDPVLSSILQIRSVGKEIGQASGLKMCFSSLTKGFTALAVQSFTTASRLGMLGELQEEVERFSPEMAGYLDRSVGNVPGKAYRWVQEMENVRETHEEGGWGGGLWRGVEGVYRFVDEETGVGRRRGWGWTKEEVVRSVGEGLGKKKRGLEEGGDGEDRPSASDKV